MSLAQKIKELICAGYSGIWVESQESNEAIKELCQMAEEKQWPLSVWDIDRQIDGQAIAPGPVQALRWLDTPAVKSKPSQILVLKNFHRYMPNPEVLQVLQNRVEHGKSCGQYIVIVSPVLQLQPEVEKLFTVVHHELPSPEPLKKMVTQLIRENNYPPQDEGTIDTAVKAAGGMTRTEAENAFAFSLTVNKKLDPEVIWNFKAQALEKAGTLSLYRGDASFEGLGGLENLKQFCLRAMRRQGDADSEKRPRGVLLLSPPGCGKSQFAKALGNEVGRPTVMLDFGSLMGKFVGESEGNMRRALALVDAMSPCILFVDEIEKALSGVGNSGQTDSGVTARLFGTLLTWLNDHKSDVFFIGTCNKIEQLPPEFTRAERFDGVFFVDLPNVEARQYIWNLYLAKFQIDPAQPRPDDTNWTGAEIKSCCRLAALLGLSLLDAAQNVVPVAVTNSSSLEELRKWADGRCLSADNKGMFRRDAAAKPNPARRKLASPSSN